MYLVFFDIDETLFIDPYCEEDLTAAQQKGITYGNIPVQSFSHLPWGMDKETAAKTLIPLIHFGVHMDIFRLLYKNQHFIKTFLITTGNFNTAGYFYPLFNHNYHTSLFGEENFIDVHQVRKDHQQFYQLDDKAVFTPLKFTSILAQAKKHYTTASQCWLADDRAEQLMYADQHGIATYNSKSDAYPKSLLGDLEHLVKYHNETPL